ncbi:hypothetical protein GAO09_06460 [Rhizobiales bacterium RZME27]|uniref:Uncharacterized protein n=1 Tax=Endobacterium cereale TaxID=2663029 RepID=A0A6A8A3B0_9HYPH|nr:hypothetical protein [Endobacterium cereale]MEB2846267.1 hypothetical protein [Endobacterium cereale]MQY45702.1 hypothetical protein [Endobacterium cereale]
MKNLAGLEVLTALEKIYLHEAPIDDIRPLEKSAASLRILGLMDTRVGSIAALKRADKLAQLD